MNQDIYLMKVSECNKMLKYEVQEKMLEIFQNLEKLISKPDFDALSSGSHFEGCEIQEILPYIVNITQNISARYIRIFLDAGMEPDSVDLHWMTIFSKLTTASPKFREIKSDEVESRIVEHRVQKEYKEAEDSDKLGIFFPAGGAVIGGTIGGLVVGGAAAVITGILIGAVAGFSTYKVTIKVLSGNSDTGKKKVEIITDTYRVNLTELQNLCREEKARACRILENWLDDIERLAKDNLPSK